jgi:hypothetical protein
MRAWADLPKFSLMGRPKSSRVGRQAIWQRRDGVRGGGTRCLRRTVFARRAFSTGPSVEGPIRVRRYWYEPRVDRRVVVLWIHDLVIQLFPVLRGRYIGRPIVPELDVFVIVEPRCGVGILAWLHLGPFPTSVRGNWPRVIWRFETDELVERRFVAGVLTLEAVAKDSVNLVSAGDWPHYREKKGSMGAR